MKNSRVAKPLLFMAPAFLVYIFIMVYPMIYSFILSLHEGQIADLSNARLKYVGFQNYADLLFRDPVFWVAIKNNIIWMVWSLTIPVIMGLFIAIILNRKFRGRILYRGLLYAPSILSFVAAGLIWGWILHPTMGFLNMFLNSIGLQQLASNWLSDQRTALFSTFMANTWREMGFPMIIFLGGLQMIPNEIYESVKIDGASSFRTFWSITLPLLRETSIVVISLTMIGSMKVFDVIYIMTNGGPARSTQVLATWMYMKSFTYFQIGSGTAVAWLLLVIVSFITIPYILYMTKRSN